MDPSRDFAYVIMNASDQIGGIQISDEGLPRVLGFEKSSGSCNLPLNILDKNGEDCSTEYKVVECYFEVDGETVLPVDVARVQEELARRSNRQKEVSCYSGSEKETIHVNGMPEKWEIVEGKSKDRTENERLCSESRTIGAGMLNSLKPDCSSEQSDVLHQMTFNVGSSSYTDCSPVEKMRRMEVRVEDFRLSNVKKDDPNNAAEENNSEMLPLEELRSDIENERLPRITRSQAKNDEDAAPRRSGRLQREIGSCKKPNANMRRISTGKLTVDATNHERNQKRNSLPGFNRKTRPEIIPEATVKRINLGKSQKLKSVQPQEIKEEDSMILKSAVPPSIVQKRPIGRPRKVVARSTDEIETMVKDVEKNLQQKDEVAAKTILKQEEGGLELQNQDVLKTDEGETKDNENNLQQKEEDEVAAEKLLKQEEGGLELQNQDVLKTDIGVEDHAEGQLRKEAEQKDLADVKPAAEDLEKLDLPVVQTKHQESSGTVVATLCENACDQTATANELLSESRSDLPQKLHKGRQNTSAAVDWDEEESQSSYDILLLKELSTDDPESKQVSDVDDPKEDAELNTKQAAQKRIFELLDEIQQFINQDQTFEHSAAADDTTASESFASVAVITESEHLGSTVKAEFDKVAALQSELNARAETLNSVEMELLTRKARLKTLRQAYDIEDAKNALEREQVAKMWSEVAEEHRKLAADRRQLRSGKYRGKTATPMKRLNTEGNLFRKATVQFCRMQQQSEEAKLQSSTKPQEVSLAYSSATTEVIDQLTTEDHPTSASNRSSSVASVLSSSVPSVLSSSVPSVLSSSVPSVLSSSVPSVLSSSVPSVLSSSVPSVLSSSVPSVLSSSVPSVLSSSVPSVLSSSVPSVLSNSVASAPLVDDSNITASTTEIFPLSLSRIQTSKDPLVGACLPLQAVYHTTSSLELHSCHPSASVPSPEHDIPLSLSFRTDAETASSPAAPPKNIPSSSSSNVDISSTVVCSDVDILPSPSSFCLSNAIYLPSSAMEVEMLMPSSSSFVKTEVLPLLPPSGTELVQPASSASMSDTLQPASSPPVTESLPPVSSSPVPESLQPISSSPVAEILLPVSSLSVAEALPSTSSPLKTEILPSGIETRSPARAVSHSPSTPSSSKSTPCRSSSISCNNISPTCRHLFSNSVCMLPSVTLVPVTAPYVLPSSIINLPCETADDDVGKSSSSRLTRKRVAAIESNDKSRKTSKH